MSPLGGRDYDPLDLARVEGSPVAGVEAEDTEATLTFRNGQQLRLSLTADCCSSSRFTDEALEAMEDLVGSCLTEADDRKGPDEDGGEVSWHFLVLTTNKGHVTLDWRNDSNGYYDGSIFGEWV